jgi:predicted alpha/beta hydrolase
VSQQLQGVAEWGADPNSGHGIRTGQQGSTDLAKPQVQGSDRDSAKLSICVFEPSGAAQANVVIAAAMGVRQNFYAPFATWLATQGMRVATFDYRGVGASLPDTPNGGLRGFQADLTDWVRDYEAVIDQAHAALPELPLYLVGHSLGGQLPGLLHNQHKVQGLLGVAAGSGYWRHTAPALKRKAHFFWYLAVPLVTWWFGYFAGRRLGAVGDLPRGVIWQWRRWCLSPGYCAGAPGGAARQNYAAVRFPICSLYLADDEMMTLRGTQALLDLYSQAPRKIECLAPLEFGAKRIGHFGFFRPEFSQTLWPLALARLLAFEDQIDARGS